MTKTLKITMSEGKWLVDIFSQANDSGVYDLIPLRKFLLMKAKCTAFVIACMEKQERHLKLS